MFYLNRKKKIIIFSGLVFLIFISICFVVIALNGEKSAIKRDYREKVVVDTKNSTKENQNKVVVERKKEEDKKEEDSKTNYDEKYEFKDPYFVSMECIYQKTRMKANANKEEIFNNGTNMEHIVNFYVLLSDAFEKEGFFNKFNKDLFLDKCLMWNDNSFRLNAETEFLIDGKENLERFKNIVANKDFGSVDITKEKLDKASNEIFLYFKKHWGILDKKVKELTRILRSKNKDQVKKAIEYYNKELNELKKKNENGYIYTNGDATQEVFLEKEIDSLKTQNSLTEEQIKEFKEELKNLQRTFEIFNNYVRRGRPKNIKYSYVKDLHKGIKVNKTVKDMKDELKYYGMGR